MRGISSQAIISYKSSFTLFLPFAANFLKKINFLEVNYLKIDLILSFLEHLKTGRKNSAKTRKTILSVIKSMAKMIILLDPEHKGDYLSMKRKISLLSISPLKQSMP